MPVYKNEDNGTWYVLTRYLDWKGERKQKCKRDCKRRFNIHIKLRRMRLTFRTAFGVFVKTATRHRLMYQCLLLFLIRFLHEIKDDHM